MGNEAKIAKRTARSRRIDRIVSTVVVVELAIIGGLVGYLIGRVGLPALLGILRCPTGAEILLLSLAPFAGFVGGWLLGFWLWVRR
ncbi:hypothetical protein QN357_01555 [Cryobacterium sp. RTC2.1]|uniref:hypothetical protein n=1 Tax=Cryobacterium sp. RTC2.1 TaxID=3048634 RepID=UPI002B23DB8F|nr:hypothetical protein [Cryobacterium sp. RTC2.1]MEB0001622.1 hypothetical protein [Cryobacterium sp. RTC2.1]